MTVTFPPAPPRAYQAWFSWADRLVSIHELPLSLTAHYQAAEPLRATLVASVARAIEENAAEVAPAIEADREVLMTQASFMERVDRWCEGMLGRGVEIELPSPDVADLRARARDAILEALTT